jgi:hypothetical protein
VAHPWLFESTLDAGSNAEWDSETDTGSLLDFPHYRTLAALPWPNATPYMGAYCARIRLGDTNDHTLTEGDIDIADGSTRYFRFFLYLAPNFTATADDSFNIFELQQAGGTREMSIGLRITAATGAVEIGAGDGVAPSAYSAELLSRDRWYCIEVGAGVSTSDAGTLTLWVDGVSRVALDTLDQAAAVGQGVWGTQDTLSTTTGTILLDWFTMDDARIYPPADRFPTMVEVTKSRHVFVGPGALDGVVLATNTSGQSVILYDTDTADTTDAASKVAEITQGTNQSIQGPLLFRRGCYAVLAGSDPRAHVYVAQGATIDAGRESTGPRYYSADGMRIWGQR